MRVDFWFAHRIDDFLDLFLLLISLSCLSLSGLDSMQNVIELLKDMLQAINPDDRKVCATVTFFSLSILQQLEKMFDELWCFLLGCER